VVDIHTGTQLVVKQSTFLLNGEQNAKKCSRIQRGLETQECWLPLLSPGNSVSVSLQQMLQEQARAVHVVSKAPANVCDDNSLIISLNRLVFN